MRIKTLRLVDFRNYDRVSYSPSSGVNVLIGQNAQGKTNLLEALSILSYAQSPRVNFDRELIRFDQPFFKAEAEIALKTGEIHLSMVLSDKKKYMTVNGVEIKRLSEFVGKLNVVLFSPSDLALLDGSPRLRRRFMDDEISKISPVYLHNLLAFNKLLKERNNLLKSRIDDPDYLSVLTDQMIDCQIDILLKRKAFIVTLEQEASRVYGQISKEAEVLTMSYESFVKEIVDDRKEMRRKMTDLYQKQREKEILWKSTLIGIHRDDFSLKLNEKDVMSYASQGQKRSAVLALKIGLVEMIQEQIGEYPVLLLDDVLSELDGERRTHLLDHLHDEIQTILTTTDLAGLDHRVIQKSMKVLVKQGTLEPLKEG